MKKTFTIIVLSILVWGCAKKIAPAASSDVVNTATASNTTAVVTTATTVPVTLAEILPSANLSEIRGQATYTAKCGKCHGLKVTADYSADRWVNIMQVMAQKAHLDDTEKENVLTYVKANAKK